MANHYEIRAPDGRFVAAVTRIDSGSSRSGAGGSDGDGLAGLLISCPFLAALWGTAAALSCAAILYFSKIAAAEIGKALSANLIVRQQILDFDIWALATPLGVLVFFGALARYCYS